MKKILLISIILLFTLLPASAVKRVDANPINVAVVLVEKGDSASIADMLKYYSYNLKGIEDGYKVMYDSNGNEMRYTYTENGITHEYPTIIVKFKENQKEIDSRLKELKFEKNGEQYIRTVSRYNNYNTICNVEHSNSLRLQRVHRQSNGQNN